MSPMICSGNCGECGKQAWGGRIGSWLVSDAIWKAAGYKSTDVACKACLSKRLRKRFKLKERAFMPLLRGSRVRLKCKKEWDRRKAEVAKSKQKAPWTIEGFCKAECHDAETGGYTAKAKQVISALRKLGFKKIEIQKT